jgi:hypothetical protein
MVSVSGMTDDAGWVDVTASKTGYESVTRRFTLAKVRQKGGVRVATALPANPSEVGGELAIFLDVADPALRGMYGWSGTAWVKTGELLNGSVTADKLAADAIQATKFADGIEPVSIVSLLPNVVGYTGPKLVFLTTDNKIYRYTGSSWVKELPAEDLTGQLVADQLASNSVTTGKIQAGAVTTDQLAAKAVTATKMVLTDTSNVYPDYDILDSAFYSGGDFTRVASASLTSGAYALRVAASAYTVRIESQWFQVEPSADYFVEVSASQSISGATGAAAVYVEFASHDGGAAAPTLTRAEQVVRRVSTTSAARADLAVTTTSNERRARLVFVREAGGTGVADFGGPVIRRRNNAKLIVDGSVVATKIAADAVQTHHLLAGAVTAEKLTVNKLSAITADMGDVTAGTFTLSSTGYIRGGATNFSTGAGFWMGYDAGTYKLRAGTPGSSGFEWTGSAFNVRGPDGSITISSGVVDWDKIAGANKPEDGATKNRIFTQATAPTGAANGDIWIDTSVTPSAQKMMVGGSWQLAATVGATFGDYNGVGKNISGTITPGNVSTYIANAAIGNAQIGGNLWSTNWNYAGGTGWLLDRSGNFYGNNIYARGDIEASSLKANTLMVNRANIVDAAVDTLQIAGNAVTVPVSAQGTSSCQTAATDFGGAPVALVVCATGTDTHSGIGSTTLTVTMTVRRNSTTSGVIKTITVATKPVGDGNDITQVLDGTGAWVIRDTPGAGSHYYHVSITGGTNCSILAIGVQR